MRRLLPFRRLAGPSPAPSPAPPPEPPAPGVVPYVHPADDPALWAALPALAASLRFLVVNVHDGPGAVRDPGYAAVLPPLVAAGAPLAGYVDTAYGAVPVESALEQAARWREEYGVRGIFLDQVVSSPTPELDRLCSGLREAGADLVVLNPGTVSAPEVLALGDVVCTYEGPWSDYRRTPRRPYEQDDPRVAHLVHTVGPEDVPAVVARARSLRPGVLAVGASRGTSTWGRVLWPLVADAARVPPSGCP